LQQASTAIEDMPEISLTVTSGVLAHAGVGRESQRQIAYTQPTSDLAAALGGASASTRVRIRLGGRVVLTVGDTSAIWRAHNADVAAAFDALFALLAQYPSQPMRFLCEITE
jgi:hypothetical protein